jgi:cytoplasmic iron level regulating protein YaaA (DUF328/UPF0246 family)
MARRIALIGCCADKASSVNPLPARQLYRSPLFRKSLAWVEQQGLEWFVISAAYGLISRNEVLMPYDHTMRNKSPAERAAWEQRVAEQIDAWTIDDERVEIVLLAGEAYAGWIPKVQAFATVEQPLKGMQIGQRLQFLTNELREGQSELFA